jgi:anti-sigma B factor antagonist
MGADKMNIEKKLENGKLTVTVGGRLDTNTSPDLEAAVKLDGVEELVFDFAGLEYIASSGLRVLLGAQKEMSAKGGKMLVANPNEMVRGVFEVTGLDGIFEIA